MHWEKIPNQKKLESQKRERERLVSADSFIDDQYKTKKLSNSKLISIQKQNNGLHPS